MAKRIDRSRHELEELGIRPLKREDEHIERLVLPTDTLQGIALLYNTTVSELKKINHIISESELHARRVIKVPSKGILVDLTEDVAKPPQRNEVTSSVNVDFSQDESVNDEDNNGQEYLTNKDSVIKEIKEQAEIAAAKSPILNGSDDPLLSRKEYSRKKGELKWWIILLPCLAVLIGFPVLYFLYREQEEELHHLHHKLENSSKSVNSSLGKLSG